MYSSRSRKFKELSQIVEIFITILAEDRVDLVGSLSEPRLSQLELESIPVQSNSNRFWTSPVESNYNQNWNFNSNLKFRVQLEQLINWNKYSNHTIAIPIGPGISNLNIIGIFIPIFQQFKLESTKILESNPIDIGIQSNCDTLLNHARLGLSLGQPTRYLFFVFSIILKIKEGGGSLIGNSELTWSKVIFLILNRLASMHRLTKFSRLFMSCFMGPSNW